MSRRSYLVWGAPALALYLGAVVSLAARAHLWNDELYTWYFARLPSMGRVWEELSTGVEQLPPFFYVLTRASLAVFGNNELALRAPAIAGIALACVCLFALLTRLAGPAYGAVAAAVPLATHAFRFSWEARPYALLVGFAAAAFLCHQLRADGVRPRLAAAGLALALAAATAVHYYGALIVLPIALGELVRALLARRVDWPVVAALLGPAVPLAIATPLILDAQRYAHAFWTRFGLVSAADFYVFLLRAGVFPEWRIPNWLGWSFTAIVLAGALAVLLRPPVERRVAPVVATALGFVLLPLAGVVGGLLVTGAYSPRYVLPAVVGPAVLVALALHRLAAGTQLVGAVAAAVVVAWSAVIFQYWHRDVGWDLERQRELIAFLERETRPDGPPVAVAHWHDFSELSHYAPPPLAGRLLRLSAPEEALRYLGSRSTEDGLVVLSRFSPLRVVPLDGFDEPFLLLMTVRGSESGWNWIEPALRADGRTLVPVASDGPRGFLLYRVR